jgi:steroid 5-alpha reductase family enzyme
MTQSMVILLLGSLVLNSLIMVICFYFSKAKNNFSTVDAIWALSFVATGLLYALMGQGEGHRKILMLIVVGIWGIRLGLHLARRIMQHHPAEDGRYLVLRERYQKAGGVNRGFFWFFQYQAWSVVLLSAPFAVMALNPEPAITVLEWVGFMTVLIAWSGESIADAQMVQFRKNHPGKTCNVGLWRYSRHPNYFFESLIWFGFFTMALASPYGVVTVYCPLLILFLLLKVTGVPMAEAQSLKSRGEEYRSYQARTSKFIPWFPRTK